MKIRILFLAVLSLVIRGREGCASGAEVRWWMLCVVLDTIPQAENASWVGVAEGRLSHQRAGRMSSCRPLVVGGFVG